MPDSIMRDYAHGLPSIPSLPSSIQKLYVRPANPPWRPGLHASILRTLKEINARGDARFVLLSQDIGNPERYIVKQWLERVDGGEGCWSFREMLLPGEEPASFNVGIPL